MPKDPMDKLRRLKQVDETWEGTVRLARTWVVPKKEAPYRPFIVAFVDKGGRLLSSKLFEEPPTPDLVWEVLSHAMHRPMFGAGKSRRPAVVYLDQEEQVGALAPQWGAIGVRCEFRRSLPGLAEALASMEQWLNRGHEPVPGLVTLPGITVPLLEHLYSAAADFYEAAPWRKLNDLHPIEIRYPPDAPARYAVVMGSGGEVYGLSVQDSLADLQWMMQDTAGKKPPHDMSWLALLYEEATSVSFDDLDAIARYGWPMPSENIYPVFWRTVRAENVVPPTRQDLLWLAGALPACVMLVKKHLRKNRGIVRPAEFTLSVPVLGSTEQVYLRLPAFGSEQDKGKQDNTQASTAREKSAKRQRSLRKTIEKNLKQALLEDGPMVRALFEFELEEHIEEYLQSKRDDRDEYFIAVTEHTNDVAMLLIDQKDVIHVNEEARAVLQKLWHKAYRGNLERLIPDMAECLDDGYLYSAGVKVSK